MNAINGQKNVLRHLYENLKQLVLFPGSEQGSRAVKVNEIDKFVLINIVLFCLNFRALSKYSTELFTIKSIQIPDDFLNIRLEF